MKKFCNPTLLWSVGGFFSLLLWTGCAHQQTRTASGDVIDHRSTGEYFDDKMIAARVKSGLIGDRNVHGGAIKVDVHQRMVQLSRFVDSERERQRAEEIARTTKGVAAVQNSIILKGSKAETASIGGTSPTSDRSTPPQRLSNPAGAQPSVTAFTFIREGNRYVGEQARDKVVQLRSEKSIGTVEPNVWYVVYYDDTATLKATEVKFANGKMLSVNRPLRVLEAVSDKSEALDRAKLRIDSDKALRLVSKDPALKGENITSSEMRLELWEGQPTWKVKVWGENLGGSESSLGEIFLSAENGTILKKDVRIR